MKGKQGKWKVTWRKQRFGDDKSSTLGACPGCNKCDQFWNIDLYDNSLWVCCNPECRALVQRSPIDRSLKLIVEDSTKQYPEIITWWDVDGEQTGKVQE